MGSIEQRRHPRINVDFFADWGWGPECEYYDKITSLSLSGCFLATKREVNSGQEIHIKFSAEMSRSIYVRGSVRYQLRVMEGAPPTGAGIEFVNLSTDSQQKLRALIEGYP
jgi:hypothetical protein